MMNALLSGLDQLLSEKKHVLLALDGRCSAGKSTLARLLSEKYLCNIIHMDDFYLPPELRTKERLKTPGGNVHYERFQEQVLPALLTLKAQTQDFEKASYQAFDCHTMNYKSALCTIEDRPLTIVEGSYCLRPEFRDVFDCKVFLDISPELQKERLLLRNGKEAWLNFESKWIPMEEQYFAVMTPDTVCDFSFHNLFIK